MAGKRVGLILSGGNIDTDVYARVLGSDQGVRSRSPIAVRSPNLTP